MDDLRQVWQTQEVESMKFSVEELRAKVAGFQHRIGRRNLREYSVALVLIAFFGVGCWKTTEMIPRIAFASIVAAAIFYVWYLRRRGSASPTPANMGSAACARFYRDELARQRDLLERFWVWALLPFVPGVAMVAAYSFMSAPPTERWRASVSVIAQAALFAAIVWANLRAAKRLSRRIAELDRDLEGI